MSLNWEDPDFDRDQQANEARVLANLDDCGIGFKDSQPSKFSGVMNVIKFYLSCAVIFGAVCALVKWPMPTLAVIAGLVVGKFIREMRGER